MLLPIHSYADENASTSRLVNAYATQAPAGARGPVVVRTAPGIAAFATPGSGPGRGLHVFNGVLYAVSGSGLYRITPAGSAVLIGTVPGTEPVFMANDGASLVLSSGGAGYIASATSVDAITDTDFRQCGACAFLDSYIVFVERESGRFFSSNLLDADSYDSLNFATAEAFPDRLVTLAVDHRQLVLFGTDTTELWYNAGGSGFPFERSPNGVIELGAAAEFGVARLDNSVLWLANDRTMRRLSGLTPQKVSQFGVEKALRGYARVDDCRAFAYSVDGQLCAVFTFPSAGATWVYNASTGEWFERETYGYSGWTACDAAACYGKTFVQHADTGAVGVLDASVSTEWGGTLRPEWTYQPIYNAGARVYQSALTMEVQAGVGLSSGQGSDPRITLEASNDGGKTWLRAPTRSIGAQGKYLTRVRWDRLGQARNRVYRAFLSDPVPLTISATELRA